MEVRCFFVHIEGFLHGDQMLTCGAQTFIYGGSEMSRCLDFRHCLTNNSNDFSTTHFEGSSKRSSLCSLTQLQSEALISSAWTFGQARPPGQACSSQSQGSPACRRSEEECSPLRLHHSAALSRSRAATMTKCYVTSASTCDINRNIKQVAE